MFLTTYAVSLSHLFATFKLIISGVFTDAFCVVELNVKISLPGLTLFQLFLDLRIISTAV